jgi:hypothetical protein
VGDLVLGLLVNRGLVLLMVDGLNHALFLGGGWLVWLLMVYVGGAMDRGWLV